MNGKLSKYRILLLGGTGTIGSAIANELLAHGHDVTILCRNKNSVKKAIYIGTNYLLGDITDPQKWIDHISDYDVIIHSANTYGKDMGRIDSLLIEHLINKIRNLNSEKSLIYTGGIWLFGESQKVIDEQSSFKPIKAFKDFAETSKKVLSSDGFRGIVIHPANVVANNAPFVPPILQRELKDDHSIKLPVSLNNSWPLVIREDLAKLYHDAILCASKGTHYIGATVEKIKISSLIKQLSQNIGEPVSVRKVNKDNWIEKYGNWVEGYFLNQKVSSAKAIGDLDWTQTRIDL